MIQFAEAFLYVAIAASSGALAFLVGQRTSGRTSREVEGCYEQATLLESLARDLAALGEDERESGKAGGASSASADADADAGRAYKRPREIERAQSDLEEALVSLRRGADLVV